MREMNQGPELQKEALRQVWQWLLVNPPSAAQKEAASSDQLPAAAVEVDRDGDPATSTTV